MPYLEILILKLRSIYRERAGPIVSQEVASLNHELRYSERRIVRMNVAVVSEWILELTYTLLKEKQRKSPVVSDLSLMP